jgi:RHS repeat-associated protein
MVRQGTVYYLHTDQLDTPRAVTDTSKNVIWRWDSDPFGKMAANEDPDGDGTAFVFNLRFAGQYYDKETRLHYNYFRYYDPSTGRYITSDPIGLAGGLNTYGYVKGNPTYWSDPVGLWPSQHGFYVHQQVTLDVVKVDPRFRQSLISGQEFADSSQFQTGEASFRHAMRNRGQSVCRARYLADKFVRSQFNKAQYYKKLYQQTGNDYYMEKSLFEFSIGLHTLQDSTSPSHSGFQVWSDSPSSFDIYTHITAETIFAPIDKRSTESLYGVTKNAWGWYQSGKLPEGNLFPSQNSQCGCQ